MNLLVLSAEDVRALLDPADCRALMREALVALASGEVFQPLRTVVRPPGLPGLIALMPSYRGGAAPEFGMKSICVFPGNHAAGKDAHQGVVTLFDARTGEPLAVMNASAITEIRTAAVSALATEALARTDAAVLTIVGTGVQARAHLAALAGVRDFREIRIVGRTPGRSAAFVAEAIGSAEPPAVDAPLVAYDDPAAALDGADVVVTATTSPDPVVFGRWIGRGTHVNGVGSSTPNAAELDGELLAASTVYADRRESVRHESGDYLRAVAAGLIGPDHIRAELGEVLAGSAPGRTSGDEITVFKSLGLAVEDIVVARYLHGRAPAAGRGTVVAF